MCWYNWQYYRTYDAFTAILNTAWRHRREDHRCEEISPCPYRGQILLERRRFSNVNQIDEEFDPGLDDDLYYDTTDDDEDEDEDDDPDSDDDGDSDTTEDDEDEDEGDDPDQALVESSAPAEEGEHSGVTSSPATEEELERLKMENWDWRIINWRSGGLQLGLNIQWGNSTAAASSVKLIFSI